MGLYHFKSKFKKMIGVVARPRSALLNKVLVNISRQRSVPFATPRLRPEIGARCLSVGFLVLKKNAQQQRQQNNNPVLPFVKSLTKVRH